MTDLDGICYVFDTCPDCRGTGYIEACYPCLRCDGDGMALIPDSEWAELHDDMDEGEDDDA